MAKGFKGGKVTIKTSPELLVIIKKALGSGAWTVEAGRKHHKLRHTSGRMVTFAGSSSDRQASKYLDRDIRHVEMGYPGRGQANVLPIDAVA